jgi:outer membrane protein assembly factor BamA
LYPQVIYTSDKTLRGYITPISGSRFSLSLTGSPPLTNETMRFVSALGDYRKYFNLGRGYSVALRGSGAASFGRDSQTYFMGGMLGWINQRWSRNIPLDRLGDTFFTLPALPLRGHPYNSLYGDKFSLINAEFRFPLFAAILPGPIPILPLYNITGVAFWDAGMVWGEEVTYTPQGTQRTVTNPASLDFQLQNQNDIYIDRSDGAVYDSAPADYEQNSNRYLRTAANEGDILMGAGFGLRTILLGFPLRYDIGWPYYRDGFGGDPIHYITIGIDF